MLAKTKTDEQKKFEEQSYTCSPKSQYGRSITDGKNLIICNNEYDELPLCMHILVRK